MSLETASFIHQLNPSNPSGADRLKEGDDHIRMIKAALKQTFPGFTGALSPEVTHTFLNGLLGSAIPTGVITMYVGDTAPTGWAICNGATVNKSDGTGTIITPDLRDRVPVGASTTTPLGTKFGAATSTATTATDGAHTHAASATAGGDHTHTISGAVGSSETNVTINAPLRGQVAGGGSGTAVNSATLTDPGHTHSLSGAATGASGTHTHAVSVEATPGHGHSVTIPVVQPSIAIHFIIKV